MFLECVYIYIRLWLKKTGTEMELWYVETWTKSCGLPLLFDFEPHPHIYIYVYNRFFFLGGGGGAGRAFRRA